MKIAINAGHTLKAPGTGAVGYLVESKETRKVAKELIKLLKAKGHTVINATIDTAISTNNYLARSVYISNKNDVDLFVSLHFNAGGGTGCEVYTWKGNKYPEAVRTCENMAVLGFKNRGVKDGSKFYVIKKTYAKALLIEICFTDNVKDFNLYNCVGCEKVAEAIVNAICGV